MLIHVPVPLTINHTCMLSLTVNDVKLFLTGLCFLSGIEIKRLSNCFQFVCFYLTCDNGDCCQYNVKF